jgi:hypothetical protein
MEAKNTFIAVCSLILQIAVVKTSQPLCPTSLTTKFFWHQYENHMASDSRGKMTGKLQGFLEDAIEMCCPDMSRLNYIEILVNDSKNMENMVSKDQWSKDLKMYFPVFGNRDSLSRYERPFIGLYDSPGLVVFVPVTNERMWNGFLVVATQLWQVIALSFLLAAISGILVWFLVSIIKFDEL